MQFHPPFSLGALYTIDDVHSQGNTPAGTHVVCQIVW
jgi:hypothetical protein